MVGTSWTAVSSAAARPAAPTRTGSRQDAFSHTASSSASRTTLAATTAVSGASPPRTAIARAKAVRRRGLQDGARASSNTPAHASGIQAAMVTAPMCSACRAKKAPIW